MRNLFNYRYISVLLIASFFCDSYGLYSLRTMKNNIDKAAKKSIINIKNYWYEQTGTEIASNQLQHILIRSIQVTTKDLSDFYRDPDSATYNHPLIYKFPTNFKRLYFLGKQKNATWEEALYIYHLKPYIDLNIYYFAIRQLAGIKK